MTEKPDVLPEPAGPTLITICPDGPLLVRGPVQIVDAAGQIVPRSRQTIALCRCGKSQLAPFCDGTHKLGTARTRSRTGSEPPSRTAS
jgi:CDGSH-type Zn-finger protein